MVKKITTLLFDVDGTLIDTNELIIDSFLHTLEHFCPGQYGREDVIPFIGPTLEETFSSIDADRTDEMVQVYRKFNVGRHDAMVKEFTGVSEAIIALKDAGYKLGIVTSKMNRLAIKGLNLYDLDRYFDCIIGCDDIVKPKPDAEPVLKALSLLQATPEEALMVGDRHHDILAGKNAGTGTVGVSWSLLGRSYLEKYQPDYIIDDMKELLAIAKGE